MSPMLTASHGITGPAMAEPIPLPIERFSTLECTGDERVERWEEYNARALMSLECRTLNDALLVANETNIHLNDLRLAHVQASAHVVERSIRHITAQPSDGLALFFTLYGESFFYHHDGVHTLRPGDLLVCNVNEPFMRGFARGLQEFVVRVPLGLFSELSDTPLGGEPTKMRFAGEQGANAHASSLARLLQSTLVKHEPADAVETERTAVQILRAMFSTDPSHRYAADRRAAEDYINRHLTDPQLSVPQVARAIGVSERQLYRAFSETGDSVAKAILGKRLDLARRVLLAPGSLAIGDIALRCGFLSHAHFSRVFRNRFGATPADVRSDGTGDGVHGSDSPPLPV